MVSRFAAADARSSAAVDFFFGEELQLVPWAGGGGYTSGGGPDETREVVDFNGTLSGALGTQDAGGDRRGSDFRGTEVVTRDRTVTADVTDWPSHGRKGDRIKALGQPGQPMYEIIVDPLFDGMNRMIIHLVNAP